MIKYVKSVICSAFMALFISCNLTDRVHIIEVNPTSEDMTLRLREVVDEASQYNDVKIILNEGKYLISPENAKELYLPITNHGNGSKRVAMLFKDHSVVEIEGRGAEFIFHGQMFPFLFERCDNVKVSGITVDWDVPFTFLGEVTAIDPKGEWREIIPRSDKDGFSWTLKNGKILFPNIDGFNYEYLGSTLAFDAKTKRPIVGALDLHSDPSRVEKLDNGRLRIYEKLRQMPPVGSLLSSKGDRKSDRYAPAFGFKESSNICIDNVVIHHALGMGFLFERCENISILNSQVVLRKNSNRVISSTADATHFANCRGDILVEDCRFENMLDDGTNVHGTYVVVSNIVDDYTLHADLQHFEQLGFKFAAKDDELWIINVPSSKRATAVRVKAAEQINEKRLKLVFEKPISKLVKTGDLLENKTWNPTFTMRRCTIQNNRARSIVLKTPLKTVIENNHFSSMMSGVLFRGESKFWYESGAVEDVLIKDNTFYNAADCGTKHSALYVTPLLGDSFNTDECYDRNIRFIGNTINSFNPRVVIADRVEGLIVKDNVIIRNTENEPVDSVAPIFELINCNNTCIQNNVYKGESLDCGSEVKADPQTLKTLTFNKNEYQD